MTNESFQAILSIRPTVASVLLLMLCGPRVY